MTIKENMTQKYLVAKVTIKEHFLNKLITGSTIQYQNYQSMPFCWGKH